MRTAGSMRGKFGCLKLCYSNDTSPAGLEGVVLSSKQKYLHISPSGDYWVGESLFAAKHLEPDYVKSFPIKGAFDPELNEEDELTVDEAIKAYDTGNLPDRFRNKFSQEEMKG